MNVLDTTANSIFHCNESLKFSAFGQNKSSDAELDVSRSGYSASHVVL